MHRLEVEHLDVRYDARYVVRDVGLALREGTIGCLLGPSGCGKTTVLRAIAGFVEPSGGAIRIGGEPVFSRGGLVPPEQRDVGMVFQDFALFPHLTVAENIGFGLREWQERERGSRIGELLDLVGMAPLRSSYPHELSGGEQQRIAVARAMAPRPAILLLDEPFASMDLELRVKLASDVRAILKQENVTAVLVTHDQQEAFAVADEICVMHDGRIRQRDTSFNLYHHPADRFVADFIGEGVFLAGRVGAHGSIETALGRLPGRVPEALAGAESVEVLVRPDDVVPDAESAVRAVVVERVFRGAVDLYTLETDEGVRLLSLMPSHHHFEIGREVGVRLDLRHLAVFEPSAGQNVAGAAVSASRPGP